jgi:tRNA 2-selenouridine synthase
MAWLFRTAGLKHYLLSGGYKAYRNPSPVAGSSSVAVVILGGPTGAVKPGVASAATYGKQVIDLEGLAHHKGSAFGSLGETAQPSTEQFTNHLHALMRTFIRQDRYGAKAKVPASARLLSLPPFMP